MQEILDVARRTRQRARDDTDRGPSEPAAHRATASTAPARSSGSLTTPPAPTLVPPDLELRLHHGNDIRVRRRARSQRGKHGGQRNERQVCNDEVDQTADGHHGQVAHIGALQDCHSRVRSQRPGQLAVTDVGCHDLACAAVEQDLGEPARRRARIETAAACT